MTEKDQTAKLPPGDYTACGGRITEPDRYPSTVYQGRKIYFCNNACFEAFKTDPDRFLAGEIEHPLDQP
jgi:YHS domain-containing protein